MIRPQPSLLLVTIDTLRADRLADGGPMPGLGRLVRGGLSFRNAHAQVPLTLPSHASILTGRGVRHHGVRDNIGYALTDGLPTVAGILSAAGYKTSAFVAGYPLVRSFGLARGFETYDDRMTRSPSGGREGHTERRAEEVVDAALDWVGEQTASPFFMWVHLFDPHDPYEAPRPYRGRHAHPYDDEVAYVDHQLVRLVEGVRQASRSEHWTIVTADHGESLGEHGEATHGVFVYESTLHVPLVLLPPRPREPRVVNGAVYHPDVAPTLLELAGIDPPDEWEGRSLLGLAGSPADAPRQRGAVYLESFHGARKYGWAPLTGYVDGPMKFISAPEPELYDVGFDPRESVNLIDDADLEALLVTLGRLTGDREQDAQIPMQSADVERLAALGYVSLGSATPDNALAARIRPDPKRRIGALPAVERGLDALAAGRTKQARRELDEALRKDATNLVALNNLGIVTLREGDAAAAAKLFMKGLEYGGGEHLANNLGLAQARLQRYEEAIEAYRRALVMRPGFTAARFNLAVALYRSGSSAAALKELERVRAEDPEFSGLDETIREIRTRPR